MNLLFCLVLGDPLPQVTWWRDSHLIDSSYEGSYSRTVQNGLSIKNLSRAELGAQLTCQASNNNLSLPVSTRVTIDMKCKSFIHAYYYFEINSAFFDCEGWLRIAYIFLAP